METSLNIFDHAKKELTQDAVISWMFSCAASANKDYETFGKKCIKRLLDLNGNAKVDVYYCTQQESGIDVYAEVITGKKVNAVIIENKVDTNLRKDQLVKYCNRIKNRVSKKKWIKKIREEKNNKKLERGDIYCIVFKKGYIDDLFLKELDNQVKRIDEKIKVKLFYLYKYNKELKNKRYSKAPISSFVEGITLDDKIWNDYKEHIRKLFKYYIGLGDSLNDIIKNDHSLFSHELIWNELGINEYSKGDNRGGSPHTYLSSAFNQGVNYNIRVEKYYTNMCFKNGTFVIEFEFRDEEKKWRGKEKLECEIERVEKIFEELKIDKEYVYSRKETIDKNIKSNKFFILRLQKGGEDVKTLEFKKLKKLIVKAWGDC